MATNRSGTVSAALTQNLRVMSATSGLAASPPDATRGSKAMPQIGQVPGSGRTISGCMGQTYALEDPPVERGWAGRSAAESDFRNAAGSLRNRRRQGSEQNKYSLPS
jgi:hypothetical protein